MRNLCLEGRMVSERSTYQVIFMIGNYIPALRSTLISQLSRRKAQSPGGDECR